MKVCAFDKHKLDSTNIKPTDRTFSGHSHFMEWSMETFNPQPSDWYSATCSFAHIGGWGFAHLEDGTEIFLPAPIKSGITSICLAVRIKLSLKPGRRPEAIEAMALEDYYKLLDEDIPA